MIHTHTYIAIKLQEDLVVVVGPESGVVGQALQEHLMHGHRLLKGGQIFPEGDAARQGQ